MATFCHATAFDSCNNEISSICGVCFGLFHESGRTLARNLAKDIRAKIPDSCPQSCFINFELPTCCVITEKAYCLQTKNVSYFNIKDQYRTILALELQTLGIAFQFDSPFQVKIEFSHPESSLQLLKVWTEIRRFGKKGGQSKMVFPSRKKLEMILSTITDYCDLAKIMQVDEPLKLWSTEIQVDSIKVEHSPVYLAGRYVKLSRELSQTPWIIKGKRKTEGSVSDCLEDGLCHFFKPKGTVKFISAGREDADVRMLGTGRPFLLELRDPQIFDHIYPKLDSERDSERDSESNTERNSEVTSSTKITSLWQSEFNQRFANMVQIKDLTIITTNGDEAMEALKRGEEHKMKDYRCVVHLQEPHMLTKAMIDKLDQITDQSIVQRTPIRVLQRRALCDRTRMIHGIKVQRVDDQFAIVHLRTQAGTYIKEFVHGDLGRSVPSLGDIIGCPCDILELDVLHVHLEWPPKSK